MTVSKALPLILLALALGCGDSLGGNGGTGGSAGSGDGGAGGAGGDGGAGGELGNPAPEPYAASVCVGTKQEAAGSFCESMFAAQAQWLLDQDDGALTAARDAATNALAVAWQGAEAAAQADGADCEDLALTSTEAASGMEQGINALGNAITDGLNLDEATQASCGAELLQATGSACKGVLDAEGAHLSDLHADADGSTLQSAKDEAFEAFGTRWDQAVAGGCPTNALRDDVRDDIEALTGSLALNTLVTPGVDAGQFITLIPEPTEYLGRTYTPQCMQGSEYRYFAKRGTVNKLLMYYQGGGACWDNLTCGGTGITAAICATTATEEDDPNNFSSGFADLNNENNPFRDWSIVFVSYCSCDVHFGDATQEYSDSLTVQHKGIHNSRVAEKWAREHFLNPEVVFVTGSSAGAYGAWFNAPLLHDVWPASQIHVLADAGNGVITTDFLNDEFSNWNFIANLPDIPGVEEAITEGSGMPAYTEAVASHFPDTNWAHYSTLYDGGRGGQTGFYNVMLEGSPLGALSWWEASCAFGETALTQSQDTFTAVPSNYRYYFGTGSRHTMWGNDKVYDDTSGNVPTVVDWIEAMLASKPEQRDAEWTNVECGEDCGVLLEGDPAPSVLEPPFVAQDGQTVIVCEE